jgi:ABC-type polysaccharide/polyol phosphate transport system ATPase subunit
LDSIIVENVSKTFRVKQQSRFLGKVQSSGIKIVNALNNINFNVKSGEMIGIIGMNGSGKTTLLRTISGIYQQDSGKIITNGMIAPILQLGTGFIDELDAYENIVMYGMLLGIKKDIIKSKIPEIAEFGDLTEFLHMKLKNYSSGMRSRLAFSTVLQVDPDIMLVDEILAVGDQVFRERSYEAFKSFKNQGKTILYTTHNLEKLSELSDRVILMDKGSIVSIGKPEAVIEEYRKMIIKRKRKN